MERPCRSFRDVSPSSGLEGQVTVQIGTLRVSHQPSLTFQLPTDTLADPLYENPGGSITRNRASCAVKAAAWPSRFVSWNYPPSVEVNGLFIALSFSRQESCNAITGLLVCRRRCQLPQCSMGVGARACTRPDTSARRTACCATPKHAVPCVTCNAH